MAAVTVSMINLKGGVGKSTLTMMLGEFLAFRHSKKVLLIDMDAQANLSYCMVSGPRIQQQQAERRTTYHLLRAGLTGSALDIRQYVTRPPLVVSNISRNVMLDIGTDLHMVVSAPDVAQLDEDLIRLWEAGETMPQGVRETLRRAIDPVRLHYDYILIDCPPGLSLFSSAALIASDYYVSPVIPEPLSLQGVELVQNRAGELAQRHNARIEFKGIILNIVKHYRTTHRKVSEDLYDSGRDRYQPFEYWLPDSEKLRSIGEYDPDGQGGWAIGVEHKFRSLRAKYDSVNPLTNPDGTALDRQHSEGQKYRLERRISHLVDEFLRRCPTKE